MRSRISIARRLVFAATLPALVALAAVQLGCATTKDMRSASGVPASQGTVSATKADNGNMNVAVRVKHLATPSLVSSGTTVYVVWVTPLNSPPQNVGALTLNDNLEGSLDTVTPHSQFKLSVTPESTGRAEYPTNAPVFTAQVDGAS